MRTSRFEVAFEQKETWRVSPSQNVETLMCPFCDDPSPMIGADYLAKVMSASPRDVYRMIDKGLLHFVETEGLHVLVCLRSFSLSVDQENATGYGEPKIKSKELNL
ncbi:hypothetical protein BH10ACI3_BH10ACI3_20540 [soil metagenome]